MNLFLSPFTRSQLTTTVAFLLLLLLGMHPAIAQTVDSNALGQFMLQRGYKSIPLHKYPTGHLYAEVEINGVMGRFIFDTGAGSTVVEEKRQLKFKMVSAPAQEKASGAGGAGMSMQTSLNNKLSIHDFSIDHYDALLMNLDHVNDAFKQLGYEQVDGVIGADILTSGKAVIDYPNMIIYLK